MKLVIPKENKLGESRVGITPDCVPSLIKMGFSVFVQSDAGINASFTNESYKKGGAKILSSLKDLYKNADFVIKVQRPTKIGKTDKNI